MSEFNFVKAVVCGNDFVIVEGDVEPQVVPSVLDRHFGIGGDGIILFEENRMRFFNPDGKKAEFCGNGTLALSSLLLNRGDNVDFIVTDAGRVELKKEEALFIKLPDPMVIMEEPLIIQVGVPHLLIPVDNLERVDVKGEGRRYTKTLENGNNVDWIEMMDHGIKIRTYERGVEDETLSCGSGVGAAGYWYSQVTGKEKFKVKTRGGEYQVLIQNGIWISAPVFFPFHGIYKGGNGV